MSLRKTTVFIILMTFVGLIVVLLGSLNAILPPYFQRQEKESIQQAALNGLAVIENQLTELEQIGTYLRSSIETYQVPTPEGTRGLITEFPDQTLVNFKIDLVAYFGSQAGLIAGKWVAPGEYTFTQLPTALTSKMGSYLLDPGRSKDCDNTALLEFDQVPLLVAAIPRNAGNNPESGGCLFMGRVLDTALLDQLNTQYAIRLQIIPFGSTSAEDDYSFVRGELLRSDVPASMVLDNDLIAGYGLVNDLQGDPAYIIEVTQSRTLYQSSQVILNYLIISLVSSTAIFSLMIFLFVEYLVIGRLTRLNREVQQITAGDGSAQLTTLKGKDEIANLGRNINAMLVRLESAQTELEQSYQQVKEGRKRLENLSHRLVDVQEEERRRIAIELHDEIGQSLTGLKLKLAAISSTRKTGPKDELEGTQKILNELIERVRKLSLDLRPAMLDDLGLLPALLWYIDQYQSQTGIRVDLNHSGIHKQRFSNAIEIAAYRIIQEGLTNIARHAIVQKAAVRINCREDLLHLEVSDSGVGFEPELTLQTGATTGLSGMRERITMLGGELTITAKLGKGTRLQVDLPLKDHVERRSRVRNHPAGR